MSFRIRPWLRDAPLARLPHPTIRDMVLATRSLDLIVGGCALPLMQGVPMLEPGVPVRTQERRRAMRLQERRLRGWWMPSH